MILSMNFARIVAKILVVAFCLWHIAAIGVYSLYDVQGHPVLEWFDKQRKIFRPYILTTSQWQRWNLFSPDPLRRVIEFKIDLYDEKDRQWHEISEVSAATVPFYDRATELKTIRRLEDEDHYAPLRERYLRDFCRTLDLPLGATLRLRRRFYVIPKMETSWTPAMWAQWQPEWQEVIDTGIFCEESP